MSLLSKLNMSKKWFLLILLLFSCGTVCSFERSNSLKATMGNETNEQIFYTYYPLRYFLLSFSVIFIGIVDYLLKSYEIPISYAAFCFLFGVICGVASLYNMWFNLLAWTSQYDTVMLEFPQIYLPITIFSLAFTIDIHIFFKSLVQILIISVPVALISACIIGFMMYLIVDNNWFLNDAFLFGVIVMSIYPLDILDWHKVSSVQIKYVTCLLHGEVMIVTTVSTYVYSFLYSNLHGWTIYWYQFVARLLRMLGLGFPVAYILGCISTSLMKFSSSHLSSLMFLTFISCFNSFHITQWIANSGLLGSIIVGIMMGAERSSLSKSTQEALKNLCRMLTCIINGVYFVLLGIRTITIVSKHYETKDILLVFVAYVMSNVSRFLAFFLWSPILSRIGYGMSFKSMVILVWCGLKNPVSMNLAINLLLDDLLRQEIREKIFFLHVMGMSVLMMIINTMFLPVLLKLLGFAEISLARLVNMNSCMSYIYEARARTIAILKMDRLLSDANWPLVLNSTSLKHPYKKNIRFEESENDREEEDFFLDSRFTYCPDCQKNVPNEPSPKELREMMKEAKQRILKLKKTIYSRLYEKGMLTKEGSRILQQAVEIASDTKDATIQIDGLFKLFAKEDHIYRFLHHHLHKIFQTKGNDYRPPKKKWRAYCYHLIHHKAFYIFALLLIMCNFTLNILYILQEEFLGQVVEEIFGGLFILTYLIEFILKIFGYSWMYILRDGFGTYFKSFWRIVEFMVLCCALVNCILYLFVSIQILDEISFYLYTIWNILLYLRFIRQLMKLKILSFCFKPIISAILKHVDMKVNRYKSLAFELGTNYILGETEILQNLAYVVDNDKIRKDIKIKADRDRLAINMKIGTSQKQLPWIASTVKTKAAIRTVLTSMKNDIRELKVAGWVDDLEFNQLLISLSERFNYVNKIQLIEPSTPKLILKSIAYMGEDENFIEYLYSHIATKKFDPGNIIVEEGELINGIYIIITGVFGFTFVPNETIINNLKESGILPVTEISNINSLDEPTVEYFIPGCTFGELAVLTGRNYSSTVTAVTHSEVYFLKAKVIKDVIELDPDVVNGLECRIWKAIGFKIALDVLINVQFYRSMTRDKLMQHLERSFVPNLKNYKLFVVNEMMQDIVLLEGVVVDFNSREVYIAPCYLPRAVQKLILPQSSLFKLEQTVETKLLIIPEKECDEYDIMLAEEKACEFIDNSSIKCLQNLVRQQISNTSNSSRQRGLAKEVTRELAKKLMKIERKKLITFEKEETKVEWTN